MSHAESHTPSAFERRQHRSEDPLAALGHLLESARRQAGGSTLALADPSGILVQGAGHFSECEELAALAATPGEAGRRHTLVRQLRLGGAPALLCATPDCEIDLEPVARGCQRILGSSALRR